jgi:hypothetical protein
MIAFTVLDVDQESDLLDYMKRVCDLCNMEQDVLLRYNGSVINQSEEGVLLCSVRGDVAYVYTNISTDKGVLQKFTEQYFGGRIGRCLE